MQHNNCHHVEIIDGYDSVTGKVTTWSWGKFIKSYLQLEQSKIYKIECLVIGGKRVDK